MKNNRSCKCIIDFQLHTCTRLVTQCRSFNWGPKTVPMHSCTCTDDNWGVHSLTVVYLCKCVDVGKRAKGCLCQRVLLQLCQLWPIKEWSHIGHERPWAPLKLSSLRICMCDAPFLPFSAAVEPLGILLLSLSHTLLN